MTYPEIWLIVAGVIGVAFFVIFVGVIPSRISAQVRKDEEYDDNEAWDSALVGMACFWAACILALFVTAYALKSGVLGFAAFIALIISVVGILLVALDPGYDPEEAYIKAGLGIIILLLMFALLPALTILGNEAKEKKLVETAKFDQTITYHLDANEHKLEGETITYPINSLRSNASGDTYTWLERKEDGALVARTVQKVNDDRYEVTLKDDLPATDTEARVERIVEYQVKSADAAAGKDMCISRYETENFGLYPRCDSDAANAKFAKARTVIHIPAGSVDKMVPVSSQ
ncbi:hypothetical protein MBO12_01235 [Candidatus Saccharibacteria bacterium]|nr:hypothetical protein [Candidatus Saccharibacteria bacterium]